MACHIPQPLDQTPGGAVIFGIPITTLVIFALVGGRLGWLHRYRMLAGVAAALALLFLAMMLVPKTGQGFEDIGYAIVAFLVAVPGLAGLLGGALFGWLLRRHRTA